MLPAPAVQNKENNVFNVYSDELSSCVFMLQSANSE